MRLTERTEELPEVCDVLPLDVKQSEIEAVAAELNSRWGRVDGVLHAIGLPESCLEIF